MVHSSHRAIGGWLLLCCLFVFATLVVGGITRLTHSGLSIVEWEPIVGVFPPTGEADWRELFEEYRQTPEYRLVNHQMRIEEFKRIFWWEYVHRLLARSIGVVFLLPFLWFLVRRRITPSQVPYLAALFILGGLQGAMGWYMVKSGLVTDPRVSQFRLAAHLGLAFVIFGAMLWVALGQFVPRSALTERSSAGIRSAGAALTLLLLVMVLSGALVAGTHAGKIYNTFPDMNGKFVPAGLLAMNPWYQDVTRNLATIQFNHRSLAWLLLVLVPWFWQHARSVTAGRHMRLASHTMLAALILQFSLGVATILNAVPVTLGAAHQAGAMLLFATVIWVNHELRCVPDATSDPQRTS